MSKYSVCVVGLGKRGKHHVTYFDRHPSFEVTAICDIDRGRLDGVAQELGRTVITSTDAREAALKARAQVFCFCTLPDVRLPMVELAISSGAQLIAFEKPIAVSSMEGLAIKQAIDAAGIKAVLSYQHRYGAHYQKVAEIITGGEIGTLHTVYATAVGWPAHMMTHMLHYTRWFAGTPRAAWVIANAAGTCKLSSKDLHHSPDYLAGFVQYDNGIRGIYEVGGGAPDVPQVSKWFHKNRIGAQGSEGYAEVYTGGGYRAVTAKGVQEGPGSMDYDLDMPGYIDDIAQYLDGTKEHPCCFANAYHNFEIWQSMYRSVLDRGQVALPLIGARNEVEELGRALPDAKLQLTFPESAVEYDC